MSTAEQAERAAFEAWAQPQFEGRILALSDGTYIGSNVQDMWMCWQARAALASIPLAPPPWSGMPEEPYIAARAALAEPQPASDRPSVAKQDESFYRMLGLLKEARAALEMWKDVAPAVSLCRDIDDLIGGAQPARPSVAQEPVTDAADEIEELHALNCRLSDLLRRTANAIRSEPPPLTLWSFHDIPDRAAALVTMLDVMQRAAAKLAATPQDRADPATDWPCAKLVVSEYGMKIAASFYAPGLPDGEHDVWCLPVATPAHPSPEVEPAAVDPLRFSVSKESGSRYAYVIDSREHKPAVRFDTLKGNGWEKAVDLCRRMNAAMKEQDE